MTRNDQLKIRTTRHAAEEHPAALKKRIEDLETKVDNLSAIVEQMLRPSKRPMNDKGSYEFGEADEEAW